MPTIFERITSGEIPAYTVYEDDFVLAFLDISQATKGHTLVITKQMHPDIFALPSDLSNHLFGVVKKLSSVIKTAFNADGINILNNNGAAAGQTVFHFHVHIIPRYDGDDLSIVFTNHGTELSAAEFKKRADLIKSALL